MIFSEDLLTRIDENHFRKLKESKYRFGLGINIRNSIGNATVCRDNFSVCKVEELQQMIDELTDMLHSIEEETGVIF